MDIGIGLPATIPGTAGDVVVEWARKADEGTFSSLGIIDRVPYPNYEPMITLAVAAGATKRIGLMTTVLLAPIRSTALLAKEAASLDALSGGRLILGLGVGGREDDYAAAGADIRTRGKRFDRQLEEMHRIWSSQPLSGSVGPIGPKPATPGGPRILIGAYAPEAINRVGRWGIGFISGGAPAAMAQQGYASAQAAWQAAGRNGKPRFVGGSYFALGRDAKARGGAYIRDYYSFMGPMAESMAESLPSTPDEVKAQIQSYRDVGMDELILWPCVPDLEVVDRLRDLI